MRKSDPHDTAASAAAHGLRSRLDRAVLGAWIGRGIACAAIAAGCLAVAIAAAAAAALRGSPTTGPSRWIVPLACTAAALAAIAGVAVSRIAQSLAARRLPPADRAAWRLDRMGVALATEARHPRLGERLSRAVEFLDDATADARRTAGIVPRPAARGDDPLAESLRRLAIADAAAALDTAGDLAVPGAAARLRWIGAGLAVTAAVTVSAWIGPPTWRAAIRGQVLGDGAARRPPAANAAAAAAATPADAAAAIAAARHAVRALRSGLADAGPLPAERLARLAARARAAADDAKATTRALPAETPAAMLPLLATGLEDVAHMLTTPAADAAAPLAPARVRLEQLAAVSDAGGRLVAASALAARLAAVLARGFVLAPGVDADDLSAGTQTQLEQLGAIAAECRRAVAADSATLRAAADAMLPAATDAVRRTCDQLDEVAVAAAVPLPGHVAANRLGRAATLATDAAGAIAAAVDLLGMTPPATSTELPLDGPPAAATGDGTGSASREPTPLDRTRAALDAVATRILAPLDADGRATFPTAAVTAPMNQATAAGGPATQAAPVDPAAAAGGAPVGPTSGQPAAGPAGVAGPPGGDARAAATELSSRERVWMLLPARERPDPGAAAREADATSAAYRPAIDAYYRLLFQSLSPTSSAGGRPPAGRITGAAAVPDAAADTPHTGSAEPPAP